MNEGNLIDRLKRRLKYRIADLLNRRDDVCWSEAVCWVEFGNRTIADLIGSADSGSTDCKADDLCYCGKFCDGRRSVPSDFERMPEEANR